MKKLVFVTFIAFACNSKTEKASQSLANNQAIGNESKESVDTVSLRITPFKEIPDEIEGCGCQFFLSKEDEMNESYLFLSDLASVGFISINGSIERLELSSERKSKDLYFFINGRVSLSIELKKRTKQNDELILMEGVFVLSRDQEKIEKRFVGSCGC